MLLHHGFTTIPADKIEALDPAFVSELFDYLTAKADHEKAQAARQKKK